MGLIRHLCDWLRHFQFQADKLLPSSKSDSFPCHNHNRCDFFCWTIGIDYFQIKNNRLQCFLMVVDNRSSDAIIPMQRSSLIPSVLLFYQKWTLLFSFQSWTRSKNWRDKQRKSRNRYLIALVQILLDLDLPSSWWSRSREEGGLICQNAKHIILIKLTRTYFILNQ